MDISVGIGNGIDIASQMKVKMKMARPPQRKRRPQYIIYGRKKKEGLPSQILEPSSRLIIIIYILKNEVRCLVDATTTTNATASLRQALGGELASAVV
jgi:hypothetical protein